MTVEVFCPNEIRSYVEFQAGGEGFTMSLHHIRKVRKEPNGLGTIIMRFGEIRTEEPFSELEDLINSEILKNGGAYA